MAKSQYHDSWADIARELGTAIRYHADRRTTRRTRKDLRGVADKLMTWANLVFVGLVVAQAFAEKFNIQIAFYGMVAFISAYGIAVIMYLAGGGEKG